MLCRFHLWRLDSTDREGRPNHGQKAPTTLVPRWLEYPTPACCGLDIIESQHPSENAGATVYIKLGPGTVAVEQRRSSEEVGAAIGVGRRRIQQIVKDALAKLIINPDALEVLREWITR